MLLQHEFAEGKLCFGYKLYKGTFDIMPLMTEILTIGISLQCEQIMVHRNSKCKVSLDG